mmetsp:Transcript_3721/g.4187  ORF Transcript_3721/g.4187 Transcript_3721/m.4187 type:complete len:108 (+) Transcript_3721:114-437(+)
MHQRKHPHRHPDIPLSVSPNGKEKKMISRQQPSPISIQTYSNALAYVASGCSQPLLMTLLKEAKIADSSCQLHMLFYYLLPAGFIFPILLKYKKPWPKQSTLYKASG